MLLLASLAFIFFSQPELPERQTIKASAIKEKKKATQEETLDPKIIYDRESALFETFYKEKPAAKETSIIDQMPEPPIPKEASVPRPAKPNLLEPLPITLTGVMVADKPSDNMALVYSAETQQEISYKLGDKILDAQIIRILPKKIVLIRSNGQQESLYLNQEDAQLDEPAIAQDYWKTTIRQIAQGSYLVDPREFIKKIKSLGQLIESMDLTTAYQSGKSIGVRIGSIDEHSLANQLGLTSGDIVESINNIATVNNENNVKIYQDITAASNGDIITLIINRSGQKFKTTITLGEITPLFNTKANEQISPRAIEQEKNRLMKEKYRFAPTIDEIRKKERKAMWEKGRRGASSRSLKTHNRLSSL